MRLTPAYAVRLLCYLFRRQSSGKSFVQSSPESFQPVMSCIGFETSSEHHMILTPGFLSVDVGLNYFLPSSNKSIKEIVYIFRF